MAKKIRRGLAWIMILTLITGQLVMPVTAETIDPPAAVAVTVDVSAALPEAPAAESQAPTASGTMTVSTNEPVTTSTSDSAAGIIQQSSSTTTTWSGTEGSTTVSGSETTTTVTGTDDLTGQTLYEGGSTAGSETTVITTPETVVGSATEEGYVTREVITSIESTSIDSGITTVTGGKTSTTSGEWTNTENGYTKGQFEESYSKEWSDAPQTTLLGEEIPSDGITIDMNRDNRNSDPKKGIYTYTGTANGEIILLEEGIRIPDGATLVKDSAGNVIGYTLSTTTEKITGTQIKEGDAAKDPGKSSTDTTGTTTAVTPDLDATAQGLGIHIDDNTQINEETNDSGDVVAYVVTNTYEESEDVAYSELTLPEAGTFPQEDGTILSRTVTENLDADGNRVIRIITTQTDANGKELNRSEATQTIIENSLPEAAASKVVYTLPEKPEDSVKTEDGITTTVTVTDIQDADGNVIGYKATTVRTDAGGNELYREENDLYGTGETITEAVTSANPQTRSTATVKTTIVETSRVTAEETTFNDIAAYTRLNEIINSMTVDETREVVMIDGKLYYIYTGSVTVSEGENHGDTTLMKPITPMSSLFNKNSDLDLDKGGDLHAENDNTPLEGFKYIGHGIDSALSVNKQSGSTSANQFRLKSADGKIYFALCIDYDTSIKAGHLYDIEDIAKADYLNDNTAEKIRSIALNGYWGTESGVGSMDDVKDLLVDYLTNNLKMGKKAAQTIAGSLTPGQALAATQAALWKYGDSSNNNPIQETNLIYNRNDSSDDEINAEYLYNALITAANNPNSTLAANEGVEFLDAEDITATSIVVKEKVTTAGNADTNVYNTDLNFTLGIEPTKLFGDLKVTVYDSNGNGIKTVILADRSNALIGLKPDTNGMYTIPDIQIAEGVTVNLKLHGTQDLGTGVYIYTSLDGSFNDSQTLVTLASGSRTVDLDIAMRLDVQEPTVTRKTSGETQYGTRTDTQRQSRTDSILRKTTITQSEWEQKETQETESSLVYTADVTLTKVSTTQTKAEKSWEFSWIKFFDPEPDPHDDDIPIGTEPETPTSDDDIPTPTDPEEPTSDDDDTNEKAPLTTQFPRTGDFSIIWVITGSLSLGGIVLMNRKLKEEE